MTPNDATASEGERRQSLQSVGLLVCSCLSMVAGACLAVRVLGDDAVDVACAPERVNPNVAPVGSLVRLPGIGLTRAHAIVAYRDSVRREAAGRVAFGRRDDLQRIKGIGPKTVAEIARWLECDGLGPDGFAASGGGTPHPFPSGPTDSPIQDVANGRWD